MADGFRSPLFVWLAAPGEAAAAFVSVGIRLSDWGQDYLRRAVPGGLTEPLISTGPVMGPLGQGQLDDWGQEYIRRFQSSRP